MLVAGLNLRGRVILDVRCERVDMAVVKDFLLSAAHAIGDARRVVLDLSHVSFIDSSGLSAIVTLRKGLGTEGTLSVVGLQPNVATLLRLTRLDRVFPSYATVVEALGTHE